MRVGHNVDRVDPDCPPYADGAGGGLAGDGGKIAAKCGKALGKAGTGFALKRLKALSACLQKSFGCVQKGGDAACLATAGAACAKAEAARQAALTKLGAAISKACGEPPLAALDLTAASGIGFSAEVAGCASFGGGTLATVGDVAACLAARHACRAEALVGTEIPRARELLVASGRDPSLDAPCLPDDTGAGAAADAKAVVKCQKALAKAGASYGAARLKSAQQCAEGVFRCVQLEGNEAGCRTKAEAKCAKLAAKVTTAAAKVQAVLAKGCPVYADLATPSGVGFAARAAECAALDTPADSVAGVASCLVTQHACRIDQLLTGQSPRGEELGALVP